MRNTIIVAFALVCLSCAKEPTDSQTRTAAKQPAPAEQPAPAAEAAAEPPSAPAEAAKPTDTAEPAEPEPSAADLTPEAAAVSQEVPTTEDFEEKATQDVDKSNLETEVNKLEKELGVKDK